MITPKAEQRFEKFLKDNPDVFQRVPLKYIASYLGITDSSLNRLRKDLMKNDFLSFVKRNQKKR